MMSPNGIPQRHGRSAGCHHEYAKPTQSDDSTKAPLSSTFLPALTYRRPSPLESAIEDETELHLTTTIYVTFTITNPSPTTISTQLVALPSTTNTVPTNPVFANATPSLSPPYGQSFTATPTSPPTTWLHHSRRSNYPRPSPPTFLYPDPIVPQAVRMSSSYLYAAEGDGYNTDYLPDGTIYFLYVLIALGFAWCTIVYWISYPPRFLRQSRDTKTKLKVASKGGDGERWTWGLRNWISGASQFAFGNRGRSGNGQGKQKPIDKPSKYAPLASKEEDVEPESAISTATTTSASPWLTRREARWKNLAFDSATDLRLRSRKRISPPICSPLPAPLQRPHTENMKADDTGTSASNATESDHSSSASSSSSNFLIPSLPSPQPRRSSSDWLSERAAFEACTPTPTIYSSFSDIEDIEAQEPTCENPTRSRPSSIFAYLNTGTGGTEYRQHGGVKRTSSWLDMVDGAVTAAVEKVVKWTGDGGGDEELLLPVARG